jgi:cytochrome c556
MKNRLAAVMLVLAVTLASVAEAAAPAPAPTSAPGWTGLTRPKDVIAGRGKLMESMEILMEPLDTITIQTGPVKNVDQLHKNANAIAGILTAVPHLFPPTTNLYDPKSQTPATIALPAIWQNFDAFYQLAGAASKVAKDMSATSGDKALRAASLKLRGSCDACHALFLRKYEPPKTQSSDEQFDFDKALGNKK